MPVTFPNETAAYRAARDALLAAEIALREQVGAVAALRRKLPEGGAAQDYSFTALDGSAAAMSSLFPDGRDSLIVYSFMFRGAGANACPMCTSILDGLEGQAAHITRRAGFAVVAAATPGDLAAFAKGRGWRDLSLYSAAGTTYQKDYHGEVSGRQQPMINVFTRAGGTLRHFWGSELLYADVEGHARHADLLWPLWNALDLTPDGRGTDWLPSLAY